MIMHQDIMVQFAKLWGIETAQGLTHRETSEAWERAQKMDALDYEELTALLSGWAEKFLQADEEDTSEYFHRMLEEKFGKAEYQYPEVAVKTNGGEIRATTFDVVGDSSAMYIDYYPEGDPVGINICTVEVQHEELCGRKDNKDIDVYVWDDPYTEDWTKHSLIRYEDIIDATKEEENE